MTQAVAVDDSCVDLRNVGGGPDEPMRHERQQRIHQELRAALILGRRVGPCGGVIRQFHVTGDRLPLPHHAAQRRPLVRIEHLASAAQPRRARGRGRSVDGRRPLARTCCSTSLAVSRSPDTGTSLGRRPVARSCTAHPVGADAVGAAAGGVSGTASSGTSPSHRRTDPTSISSWVWGTTANTNPDESASTVTLALSVSISCDDVPGFDGVAGLHHDAREPHDIVVRVDARGANGSGHQRRWATARERAIRLNNPLLVGKDRRLEAAGGRNGGWSPGASGQATAELVLEQGGRQFGAEASTGTLLRRSPHTRDRSKARGACFSAADARATARRCRPRGLRRRSGCGGGRWRSCARRNAAIHERTCGPEQRLWVRLPLCRGPDPGSWSHGRPKWPEPGRLAELGFRKPRRVARHLALGDRRARGPAYTPRCCCCARFEVRSSSIRARSSACRKSTSRTTGSMIPRPSPIGRDTLSRDGARTPMPWNSTAFKPRLFSTGEPWLPLGTSPIAISRSTASNRMPRFRSRHSLASASTCASAHRRAPSWIDARARGGLSKSWCSNAAELLSGFCAPSIFRIARVPFTNREPP